MQSGQAPHPQSGESQTGELPQPRRSSLRSEAPQPGGGWGEEESPGNVALKTIGDYVQQRGRAVGDQDTLLLKGSSTNSLASSANVVQCKCSSLTSAWVTQGEMKFTNFRDQWELSLGI